MIIKVIVYLAKRAWVGTGTGVAGRSGSGRLFGPLLLPVRALPVRFAPQYFFLRDAEHPPDGVVHALSIPAAGYVGRREGFHAMTIIPQRVILVA
jgi:hypothetical protein